MKTINVDDKTWERIHILKLKYKFRSITELIKKLVKIANQFDPELKEEMK